LDLGFSKKQKKQDEISVSSVAPCENNKKYEAFGNIVWEEGIHDDNREFTSKEKDPTGFNYFGARYYYGNIGRFLSPDPHTVNPGNIDLSNPQELNPYVYCVNNPIQFKDPNGKYYVWAGTDQMAKLSAMKTHLNNMTIPDVLSGKEVKVPFVKSLTPSVLAIDGNYDEPQFGPFTQVKDKTTLGRTKHPFLRYQAAPGWEGCNLSLGGVKNIGNQIGTGKDVFQIGINTQKIVGTKILEDGKESPIVKTTTIMTLTGTAEQLNAQLNPHGLELYEENKTSWQIREINTTQYQPPH